MPYHALCCAEGHLADTRSNEISIVVPSDFMYNQTLIFSRPAGATAYGLPRRDIGRHTMWEGVRTLV